MQHLFDLVFEYRNLLARRKAEGPTLDSGTRHRLDALHRLLGREPLDPEPDGSGAFSRRRHARCEVEQEAALRIGTAVAAIELVNLSAGGVCALTPEPLPIGERGTLRVVSPETGRTYECSVLVQWTTQDEEQRVAGLRFIGLPSVLPPAS